MKVERALAEPCNAAMGFGIMQTNPHVGAIDWNLPAILSRIEEARRERWDLVVFPKLSLCGYPPFDLLWRVDLVERMHDSLHELPVPRRESESSWAEYPRGRAEKVRTSPIWKVILSNNAQVPDCLDLDNGMPPGAITLQVRDRGQVDPWLVLR
ncbi:MAG: hypothetical protein DDT30_01772 [Dehalococcoidia bacterium]|nr:hypothetical protein [Bacillota bacterium]